MAGIYIHIPFCKQACHYCDFHFSTTTDSRRAMVKSIAHELKLQQHYIGEEVVETIYFGGGTPSLLSDHELQLLFETIHAYFYVAAQAEITLEANPDDLNLEKLKMLSGTGVNRLSIGIQSFNDSILKYLNRSHDSSAAFNSVMFAREAGFNNISIDLIYAIPGQDDIEWHNNIVKAIDAKPEHVSSYSLTIEPKTAFGNWYSKGKLMPVKDEVAASQLEFLIEELSAKNYEHYEVSNFALPGYYSRHNSSYWKGHKYLGIGPSAHSYNGITRHYNISNNALYIKSLDEDKLPYEQEILSKEDHINEYLLTTLRTSWGCNLDYLKTNFNYDVMQIHYDYIKDLKDNELAKINDNLLVLTTKGKLLADKISSDLFVVTA
jgi:oxygen-independent coproporphyrinogen-3 oxidase